MMTPTRILLTMGALVLSAPVTMAQYSSNSGACSNGGCSLEGRSRTNNPASRDDFSAVRTRLNGSYTSPLVDRWPNEDYSSSRYIHTNGFDLRSRFEHEKNRLRHGYDYRAPLNSAVEENFRTPLWDDYRNRDRNYGHDYTNNGRDSDYGCSIRGPLANPFRLPTADDVGDRQRYRTAPLSRTPLSDTRYESRYRIPLEQVDYSDFDRTHRPSPLNRDRLDFPSVRDSHDFAPPVPSRDNRVQPGLDPFTPPLPRRETGSEAEAIYKAISARYGNPVTVRAAGAMTSSQALAMYREVSQQTDQRHLEPSSYDLRVRRGLRNLGLALENPTFTRSLGVQADSFRADGFRSTLSRLQDSMRVANYSDAEGVVQTVMREAQAVPGLTASVVAFEFANATIDTLDKFSALEPREPGRGASLDLERAEKVRSALLEGEIVGVGVEVKVHDDGLLVVRALRGGPAAEAGLQSGDIITAINGRRIGGMSMASSVDLMKGSSGSRIQMQITRNGSRASNVTLVRRRIRVYTVNDAKLLPGTEKVAYISLSQFGQKSTQEVDQALKQLYNSGMKSLVLDLRGNPGGLLNVCVDITNRFLPCGTIVSTKGRLSGDNMLETATYSRTWSTPLVVLIDGDSASASEIFAAAVQDNRRGIVVGEKSYGKGTVQTHFPLSSVNGNLRLTTARFYSPNGRPMSGQGVTPDVRIVDEDGPANGDRVLAEAMKIAQSQRLRDIAQAAKKCRPSSGQQLRRNSFNGGDIYDTVAPKTVLR
ncbi:MAG: S41 family peptidase [Fuerstiella sp.]|nr:S41 family peptidase [Fuerstiella sp.]MCP4854112.1 S41 family peptidase [Fuerstiella sp.]